MAIEFLCPYCQAAIRVPDAAAGKQGKCPACTKRVLVPHVEIHASPPQAPAPTTDPASRGVEGLPPAAAPSTPFDFSAPARDTPFPAFGAPAPAAPESGGFPPLGGAPAPAFPGVSPPATAGGGASPFDVGASSSGPTPFPSADPLGEPSPLALKYARDALARKRRKRAILRAVVPLTAMLSIVAVIGIVAWKPTPKLEGKLNGKVLPETFTPSPKMLSTDTVDLSPETVASALEALSERSEVLVSDRMRLKFRGEPKRGLEVSVDSGVQMVVLQVDLKQDGRLYEYCTFEKEAFNVSRLDELNPAFRKLLLDYDTAVKANTKMDDLARFRDSVGLAGLTAGIGYVVQARAGSTPFRCVGENDGKLYFLVPKDAKSLVLEGRKLPDGSTPFAGKYTIDVESLPAEQEPEEAPASKKGKGAKSDDTDDPESEMKPEMKSDDGDQKS